MADPPATAIDLSGPQLRGNRQQQELLRARPTPPEAQLEILRALGEARGYPINATELATLAGVTYKQIRDWDKGGLLPSHDIDGRRQYFSAAALTACALKPLDKWQIAALRGVLSSDPNSGFRRLIDYVSA